MEMYNIFKVSLLIIILLYLFISSIIKFEKEPTILRLIIMFLNGSILGYIISCILIFLVEYYNYVLF
jgi:hypothetical protein